MKLPWLLQVLPIKANHKLAAEVKREIEERKEFSGLEMLQILCGILEPTTPISMQPLELLSSSYNALV